MVRVTPHDQVMLFCIVGIAWREFEAQLKIDWAGAQNHDLELEISFGLHIIFVFPFESHALDVIKWFNGFLVAIDGMYIVNPYDVIFIERGF